jgi:hypothetical protein
MAELDTRQLPAAAPESATAGAPIAPGASGEARRVNRPGDCGARREFRRHAERRIRPRPYLDLVAKSPSFVTRPGSGGKMPKTPSLPPLGGVRDPVEVHAAVG